MSLRLTFGIDPGLSGAIVTLVDGEPGPMLDMPTTRIDGKNEVNAPALAEWIREQRAAHPGADIAACIERVRAIRREGRMQGGVSMFQFGDGYGQVKAVFGTLGIPYVRAEPMTWKRHMGLLKQEKDAARLLAIRRFPSAAEPLQRKKDCGRADALLVALWYENVVLGPMREVA